MQTWLPYPDFAKSAQVLRDQELGRQRVDAKMALNALLYPERESQWRFHPVCRMWKDDKLLLLVYYETMVREWRNRGRKHNMTLELPPGFRFRVGTYLRSPWWLGQEMFHEAQQSALIKRCPDHYRKLWKYVPDYYPVVWPVMRNGSKHRLLNPAGGFDRLRGAVPF